MFEFRSLARAAVLALTASASLALGACNSSSSSTPSPAPPAQVRAIHGSPDAGAVDIYVYKGSRPSKPTISGATFPQITDYLKVPPGTYTVDVLAAGSPSTGSAVASETVSVKSNVQYSIAVGGQVAGKTLQFVNFVEPAETAGTTAVIVHHASPAVQGLVSPVGVGIYDAATAGAPAASATTQLFTFSLASPSGPAASGTVSGGQFFLSPLPGTGLPAAIGFAAGVPGSTGSPLGQVVIYSTLSGLATGLTQPTSAQQTLAEDSTNAIPAGAHLSIFAIDAPGGAELVGTLDP